jgi:hypothetical protein
MNIVNNQEEDVEYQNHVLKKQTKFAVRTFKTSLYFCRFQDI